MENRQRLQRVAFLGWILAGLVASAHAGDRPGEDGKADFQRICSGCHSLDRSTSQRMTRTEWAGVVGDMVGRGAQGTSAELDNVISYLSDNFGTAIPSAPVVAAPLHAKTALVADERPLTREQTSEAKKLIQDNGCSSCHRVDRAGSYAGPALDGIGVQRSQEQLRAALLSPNKQVLPENRSVHLVTREGTAVTGKLLNQDGFTLLLIDASGQLASYEKAALRSFAIVTTNPMPSYANKLSSQELADLVQYLSTL